MFSDLNKKLVYWRIAIKNDSDCYDIIAKTKKEALLKLDQYPDKTQYEDYITKNQLLYKDAFDLFEYSTSEAGGRSQIELKRYKIK
jgi:hypothetical protein